VFQNDDINAAWVEAIIRLQGGVAVPPELLPRVVQLALEHRAAMRRFAVAGIEPRDVFPAQVYRAIRSET
jgi:hypothetical protein